MSLKPWKKIRDELISKNPYWQYREMILETGEGKKTHWYYTKHRPFVCIISVEGGGKIRMVRQYRPAPGGFYIEFPKGMVEDGEEPKEAAHRELGEETSLGAKSIEAITALEVGVGSSDLQMHVFLASNVYENDLPSDDTEEFEQISLTIKEVDALFQEGRSTDGESAAAWLVTRGRVQEIIDQMP